jgi:ribonuclease R
LKRARDAREPLDLDLPERKIVLKADGSVDRVFVPERLAAHRLIEEFMIQANVAAAETLEKARSVLIYRVHDEPSLEKMRVLGEVLATIGIKLPKQGALKPALFNRILHAVDGTEHQIFINEVVLRSQAQAEYAAENYGHFGLNLRRYAHFTSPIRRYADLVVHRAPDLRRFGLGSGRASGRHAPRPGGGDRGTHLHRRTPRHGRPSAKRRPAHRPPPADRVGATFAGKISGSTRSGLFVKLAETGADGFIPARHRGDYYRFEEDRHAMVGERTGETVRLAMRSR